MSRRINLPEEDDPMPSINRLPLPAFAGIYSDGSFEPSSPVATACSTGPLGIPDVEYSNLGVNRSGGCLGYAYPVKGYGYLPPTAAAAHRRHLTLPEEDDPMPSINTTKQGSSLGTHISRVRVTLREEDDPMPEIQRDRYYSPTVTVAPVSTHEPHIFPPWLGARFTLPSEEGVVESNSARIVSIIDLRSSAPASATASPYDPPITPGQATSAVKCGPYTILFHPQDAVAPVPAGHRLVLDGMPLEPGEGPCGWGYYIPSPEQPKMVQFYVAEREG